MRPRLIWRAVAAVAITVPALAMARTDLRPDMGAVPIGSVGQWFGPSNYPPEAIRAARQGRVVADVQVDAGGTVTGCSVEQSSGTTALDTATCSIAIAHLRFDPATGHDGRPIASTYVLPVRWVLPTGALPTIDVTAGPPVDSVVEVAIAFDANGVVLSCHATIAAAPGQTIDPCASLKVGTPSRRRWQRNGQPVGATIIQRFSEHTVVAP